jgi:tetratricopeptide (TPR) repeat protein
MFLAALVLADVTHNSSVASQALGALRKADQAFASQNWESAWTGYRQVLEWYPKCPQIESRRIALLRQVEYCMEQLNSRVIIVLAMARLNAREGQWAEAVKNYEKLLGKWSELPEVVKRKPEIEARLAECRERARR